MNNLNLEKIFFNKIASDVKYLEKADVKFFSLPEIKELIPIHKDFWGKYHKHPSLAQIKELVKMKGLEDELTESKLDSIYNIDIKSYDDDWMRENLESFIEYKNLQNSIFDIVSYLKGTPVTTDNVKQIVDTVKTTILTRNNLDFGFDEGLDFFNPESHKQLEIDTFSTGYNFMDLVLEGGWADKTLNVLAGRAKIGKSIWLANLAANAVTLGKNTAYISCEMSDRKIIQRLGSNLLDIEMSNYKNIAQTKLTDIKHRINSIPQRFLTVPGHLQIKEFGTGQASVMDIEGWLKKTEELKGIKFKFVIIDYLNILMNYRNPNTENLYMKIKQIAEDLRGMAQRNNWIIISATQINRTNYDSTDMTLSDISESMGLVHTVDSLFGIIQDPLMHSEKYYYLKMLANRNGGYMNAKMKFIIDYTKMKITEDQNSTIIED